MQVETAPNIGNCNKPVPKDLPATSLDPSQQPVCVVEHADTSRRDIAQRDKDMDCSSNNPHCRPTTTGYTDVGGADVGGADVEGADVGGAVS